VRDRFVTNRSITFGVALSCGRHGAEFSARSFHYILAENHIALGQWQFGKESRTSKKGFDTLNFSTCQSRRSAIIRHIKINSLSEPYNGKMVSSSQLLN
jgi:hypothetical protein